MARVKREMHPCSSCDDVVPVDSMSNEGRCERCEEESPLEEYNDED